jgi:hypothetical protein
MLRPALFVLVAMAAVASSIDVARLRRAVLYPDEDYDNADNEAAKADAAKKAKGPTATAEEKDAAQLGSPVPNATQHMEEWPTCRKLKVVPGGEGKFAAIAHKECRAQAVDDLAAVKNCFQNKCFLALNGNAPARDGNNATDIPKAKNVTTPAGEVKPAPGGAELGKLSKKDYVILASSMPGHRVSHFCQLDGHALSPEECADHHCMKDMLEAWTEYFHNNGKELFPERRISTAIFPKALVYKNTLKALKVRGAGYGSVGGWGGGRGGGKGVG